MGDCKRKCSLFIHEKCRVILQVEALVADQCGLFLFPRVFFNDAFDQTNSSVFMSLLILKQVVCIFRFYQIRANLKVPPRVPHKVETSLLHPGGKYIFRTQSDKMGTVWCFFSAALF